jgi:mannose-6-phosphate isomerase-like protein (cupin superfamily)
MCAGRLLPVGRLDSIRRQRERLDTPGTSDIASPKTGLGRPTPASGRLARGRIRVGVCHAPLGGGCEEQSMQGFQTKRLPVAPDAVAPDGSDVRVLLALEGGSLAHFELPPGKTSIAVAHRTVEEIWYFLGGRGEMWRKLGEREEVAAVEAGVCITLPVGTRFQFRASGPEPLSALGVTMPPWPGGDEAYVVPGKWEPSLPARAGG